MSKTIKERPILMSGAMVRAILEGRKTQTRRVVDFLKPTAGEEYASHVERHQEKSCKYGTAGDRLWVREAWRTGAKLDNLSPKQIEEAANEAGYTSGCRGPLWYEADGKYRQWGDCDKLDFGDKGKLRPSLFMPRWASRLTLKIVSVRVERLQDISEEDAKAEGVESWRYHWSTKQGMEMALRTGAGEFGDIQKQGVARTLYRALWESINGPGSWEVNPWVWVVEFKEVKL